jgi:hypothetical protein
MKALGISVASLALLGAVAAQAQNTRGHDRNSYSIDSGTSAEFRWSDARDEGTLVRQVDAIYAAFRRVNGIKAEPDVSVVEVSASTDDPIAQASATCRMMELPGSRIRAMRFCNYAPTEAEERLNDYQFREEIREIRDMQAIQAMEQAVYDRAVLEGQVSPNTP